MFKKCIVTLVLSLPSVCFAWGGDGHKIVADIAWSYLDGQTCAAVEAILGDRSITDVATWADEVRKQPQYLYTDHCHTVTVPPGVEGFDLKRDCPKGVCAVAAIEKFAGVLRDPQATPVQRREALMFVIHFVGDIHCPVHASYPRGNGGGDTMVTFLGEQANIHKVWDSLLINHVHKPWKQYATELRAKITDAQRSKWAGAMNPSDWATESYHAAVDYAHVVPKDGQIGEEYFARGIPVVNQRLSMGGVRLATLLNSIFGKSSTTKPAVVPAKAATATRPE